MFNDYDEVLSVTEVAEILKVGKNTVYEHLENKTLRGIKLGKNQKVWKILKEDLINFIHQDFN